MLINKKAAPNPSSPFEKPEASPGGAGADAPGLLTTDWNKSQAAAQLPWRPMTLYRKMAKYKIIGARDPGIPQGYKV